MKTAEALHEVSLERSSTPNYLPETPDLGGRQVIIPRINDRILPAREAPRGFENDLAEVNKLQKEFNRALGIDVDEEGIKNYNPVLARWRYETLTTDEQRQQFRAHEASQVETALRERYDSAESSLIYAIDGNNRLRNSEIFPEEPFAKGMQRGVLYLRQQGSPDSEREQKEVEGFLKVETLMVDPETPVNTKMMVISPPSKLEGTIYVKNFVDFYELQEINGERVVKMTRFASDASYPEELSDAYLLSHPTRIEADDRSVYEIFREKFEAKKGALEEAKMKEILIGSKGRIRFFIKALCDGDPESIALAFNAVLNGADIIEKNQIELESQTRGVVTITRGKIPDFKNIQEEVMWLGRQKVEARAGGCGISAGFSSKKGFNSIGNLILNSSGGFEEKLNISEDGEWKLGSCVVCKGSGIMVGECSICQSCADNMN